MEYATEKSVERTLQEEEMTMQKTEVPSEGEVCTLKAGEIAGKPE